MGIDGLFIGSGTLILTYPINGLAPGSYTAARTQMDFEFWNTFPPL